MTGLPKKKISRGRGAKRGTAKVYQPPALATCSNCGGLKLAHVMCPNCGFYKQRPVRMPKETTKVTRVSQK